MNPALDDRPLLHISMFAVGDLLRVQLGRDPSDEEVTAMLNSFDKDKDGKVRGLTAHCEGCHSLYAAMLANGNDVWNFTRNLH